jgi:ankyrin repeat protein
MTDVSQAIETGDTAELERLLAEDRSRADALIRWGDGNECHPIHYVCDKVFDGTLQSDKALPLVQALIAAGADIDFGNGDPLNAAVSLGVPEVALLLLESGARPDLIGQLGETSLHWAAFTGSDKLAGRLIDAGAPIDIEDARWHSTPLGWALHGWSNSPVPADQHDHRAVVLRLARAGASGRPEWLGLDVVKNDEEVLAALREQMDR